MPNWADFLGNPKLSYLKQSMFDVLKERYGENEPVIERVGSSLITEGDIRSFFKMVSDVYEIGYLKAVEDHREQLRAMGLEAKVT